MKAGILVAAMVQLAAAQPHQNRHAHMHDKRDIVTEVKYVTATAPDAVVYVNQQGKPVSTSYVTEAGPKATPQRHTVVAEAPASPTPNHHHKHHHHAAAAAAAAADAAAANANADAAPPASPPAAGNKHHHSHGSENSPANGKSHGSGSGLSHLQSSTGIVYSPYNGDNSCKSAGQVKSDLAQLTSYDTIRLYGVDCDQVNNVAPIAKANGQHLMLGVYDISSVSSDISTMHSALGGDWSNVDVVSIGNELVNSGQAAPGDVVAAIGEARGALKSTGYTGPVVTVDTFLALQDNPELCQASDFAAANAHAFFDSTISADGAGSWTKQTQQQVANACNKPCIITEAGWPHTGTANGAAIPGFSEQASAISSLKSSFSNGGIILFTAFDDLWKPTDAATFDAEKYWGILSGQ